MIRSMLNHELDDLEEHECEVNCPYCNEIFFIDIEDARNETVCPYCNNVIELDWNDSID